MQVTLDQSLVKILRHVKKDSMTCLPDIGLKLTHFRLKFPLVMISVPPLRLLSPKLKIKETYVQLFEGGEVGLIEMGDPSIIGIIRHCIVNLLQRLSSCRPIKFKEERCFQPLLPRGLPSVMECWIPRSWSLYLNWGMLESSSWVWV